MVVLAIIVLTIGILMAALLIGFIALKLYAKYLINSGKWLATDHPEWLGWLLVNLT